MIKTKVIDLGNYGLGISPIELIPGINPNMTSLSVDLDEIRQVIESTSNHERSYKILLGENYLDIVAFSSVYLSEGFGNDFGDSGFFAQAVPILSRGRSFLEIGCGTGIVSIATAKYNQEYFQQGGTPYVAIDINPVAVKNAKINVLMNKLEGKIEARQGDAYSALNGREKFDIIFWNHPFHKGNPEETFTQRTGFDPSFRGLTKYATEGHSHLNPAGKLLLGTGNFADLDDMRKIMKDAGLEMHLLTWTHKPMDMNNNHGFINTYNIYEIKTK